MPEHLRALVVVMGLALPFWFVASRYVVPAVMTAEQYAVRTKLWVFITLAAFLSHDFALFSLIAAILLWTLGRKDSDKCGLFLMLFLVIPPYLVKISGFGVLEHLIEIHYFRLLVLVVLLPAWFLTDTPIDRRLGSTPVDWAVVGLGLLFIFDTELGQGFTFRMRQGVYWFIDIFLPYRCMVILNRQNGSVTKSMNAFVIGVIVLGLLGIFEILKGWLLYYNLREAMGLPPNRLFTYMSRDGFNRSVTTAGHPINFGFLLVVALAFYIRTVDAVSAKWPRRIGFGLLICGLIASMSRGPWVGAIGVLVVWIFFGGDLVRRLKLSLLVLTPVVSAVLLSPFRDKFINLIPFFGETHADTVEYRQNLFWVSVDVIATFPVLGPPLLYASQQMQSLIQGQGIIDVVNTYIRVGLQHGLIGLALFCGAFLICASYVARTMLNHVSQDGLFREATALFAALVGVLITIATTSSTDAIPITYWMLAGLCVAHGRSARAARMIPGAASFRNDRRTLRSQGQMRFVND